MVLRNKGSEILNGVHQGFATGPNLVIFHTIFDFIWYTEFIWIILR